MLNINLFISDVICWYCRLQEDYVPIFFVRVGLHFRICDDCSWSQ